MNKILLVVLAVSLLMSCSIEPIKVGTLPIDLREQPLNLNIDYNISLDDPVVKSVNPDTRQAKESWIEEFYSKDEIFRVVEDVIKQTFAVTTGGKSQYRLEVFLSKEFEARIKGNSSDYVIWTLVARYVFSDAEGRVIKTGLSKGSGEDQGFMMIDSNRPYNLTLKALNNLALQFAADLRLSGRTIINHSQSRDNAADTTTSSSLPERAETP